MSVTGENWTLSTRGVNLSTFKLWCEPNSSFQRSQTTDNSLLFHYPSLLHIVSSIWAREITKQISIINRITICNASWYSHHTAAQSIIQQQTWSPVQTASLSIVLFHWFFWWVSGMLRCSTTKCCAWLARHLKNWKHLNIQMFSYPCKTV